MPQYSALPGDKLPDNHRVIFNGEDVTDCCSQCNTDEGWAVILPHKRRECGASELLDGSSRIRHGKVEIVPCQPTTAYVDMLEAKKNTFANPTHRLRQYSAAYTVETTVEPLSLSPEQLQRAREMVNDSQFIVEGNLAIRGRVIDEPIIIDSDAYHDPKFNKPVPGLQSLSHDFPKL